MYQSQPPEGLRGSKDTTQVTMTNSQVPRTQRNLQAFGLWTPEPCRCHPLHFFQASSKARPTFPPALISIKTRFVLTNYTTLAQISWLQSCHLLCQACAKVKDHLALLKKKAITVLLHTLCKYFGFAIGSGRANGHCCFTVPGCNFRKESAPKTPQQKQIQDHSEPPMPACGHQTMLPGVTFHKEWAPQGHYGDKKNHNCSSHTPDSHMATSSFSGPNCTGVASHPIHLPFLPP